MATTCTLIASGKSEVCACKKTLCSKPDDFSRFKNEHPDSFEGGISGRKKENVSFQSRQAMDQTLERARCEWIPACMHAKSIDIADTVQHVSHPRLPVFQDSAMTKIENANVKVLSFDNSTFQLEVCMLNAEKISLWPFSCLVARNFPPLFIGIQREQSSCLTRRTAAWLKQRYSRLQR